MPTGSSPAHDAGQDPRSQSFDYGRLIYSSLDFCFPRLLFLRSPGVVLKPFQISTIFAGNPLKLIWQLCEVELIADQIRGADGANGWMECQGIIQSAGSQWDGTFYLALCEGSESARAGQSDSAVVTRSTNQIPPRSQGRPIRFSRPLKGLLEYHHGDEFGRQPSSAAHFLLEHFLWVTNTHKHRCV